jgi:ADP-heptose:LPS heptosyltransferase
MSAEALAPLLALPDFEFHCLQQEVTDRDEAWLEAARPSVCRHTLSDFAGTAVLIEQMDAVVTIDTAVAFIARALAKPVSAMLPFYPYRRWLLGGGPVSLWYLTARLIRQPVRGARLFTR